MTARKHHTVPQSLLRHFAVSHDREQVWVYDKEEGRGFMSAIRDAAAERDFYVVRSGERRLNWEPAFQALDDRLASVTRELLATDAVASLAEDVLADVPMLVAIQLLRTQLRRSSISAFADQLNEATKSLGFGAVAVSDDQARRIHLRQLLGVSELAESLAAKDLVLLQASIPGVAFWLSDSPVVMYNTFPYGEVGVSEPGIEIYFPISPARCLALYCPSIGEQVAEALDTSHPRPRLADPWYEELLRGIRRQTVVEIGQDFVTYLNELQIRQSARFLYAEGSEFGLAESVLAAQPDLRRIRTLTKLGEMGAGPPPYEGMPPGTFLLLVRGYRHHLVAVHNQATRPNAGIMKVEALDHGKLSSIGIEAPFDSATLIVDGQTTSLMRDVVVEPEARRGSYLVRHADQGLRQLFEGL